MDAHSLIDESFWRSADSLLLESGAATAVEGLSCPSVVFSTSGSTGVPRRIVLSKQSLLVSAAAVNEHLQVTNESVWGLCLPCWHVGGFGVIARAYQAGCGLAVVDQRWHASEFYKWLCDQEVTHLSLVPTQVHDLVSIGLRAPASLSAVVVGGGRLEQSLGQAARDLDWPVLASYGMTEAGSQIATQSLSSLAQSYASEPMPILPCWQVRRVEEGRLEIAGPALFYGEMMLDQGAWVYQPRYGDWYATQDCGLVENGQLRLTHRFDALVKVLGELVNPAAIESEFEAAGLPVGKFAVIAVADPRREHRLVLVHEMLKEDELSHAITTYHRACPGFARIDECRAIAEVPRSSLGKILRKELQVLLA